MGPQGDAVYHSGLNSPEVMLSRVTIDTPPLSAFQRNSWKVNQRSNSHAEEEGILLFLTYYLYTSYSCLIYIPRVSLQMYKSVISKPLKAGLLAYCNIMFKYSYRELVP